MIEIVDYEPISGNKALKGYFNVRIPKWNMEINHIAYFEKENDKWIGLPCKFKKEGDKFIKQYDYIVFDSDMMAKFQEACIARMAEYLYAKEQDKLFSMDDIYGHNDADNIS